MEDKFAVICVGLSLARLTGVRNAIGNACELRDEPAVASAASAAARTGTRHFVVDLASDVEAGLRTIAELAAANPAFLVVALATRKDPDVILRAMRAGAREFVLLDPPDELQTVVRSWQERLTASTPTGTILAVFPAKGGTGATTVATNVAGALQEGGKRVLVVDLDLQLGDVMVFLDMSARYALSDVIANVARLDRQLLVSSVARHRSGLHVLAQTDRLEDADKVTPAQVGPLLHFLARHFDYVVVDGFRGFDDLSLAALDAAKHVLLLLTQEVPAIKNAQRCLDVFSRVGYEAGKVHLVVNRFHKADKIDLQAIADSLGYGISGAIANDYPTVIKAVNAGTLIADSSPRGRVTQDIARLALMVSGRRSQSRPSGIFRSLFGARSDDEPALGAAPFVAAKTTPGAP